jgi:DNA invertase Pin-like site-specific DNA recombinase
VVVVHRLDRLTRHLGDLQKLMALFEHHGVALVSVPQSRTPRICMGGWR